MTDVQTPAAPNMSKQVDNATAEVQTPSQPNMSGQVDLKTIPISPEGGSKPAEKGADDDGVPVDDGVAADDNGNPITVFHDKNHFNVIHPLAKKWTLWLTKPPSAGKGKSWNELLNKITTISSVEEFWGVYNNIAPVSDVEPKSDYHLFKDGVRPEWEDPQNKHGGKWSYQFKNKSDFGINQAWLMTMLAAIGETLENDDDGEVMGVVVNVRKAFYRIGLWTRTQGRPVPGCGDEDVSGGKGRSPEKGREILLGIGRRFKQFMGLPASQMVEFVGHVDAANNGSSRAKPKLTV